MLNKLSENIDYELVPTDTDQWHVRFLTGDFIETVIEFGTIRFDGDTGTLRWNMEIISSPDPDLTTESLTFQEHCGNILQNIMDSQIAQGNAILTDRDTGKQWVGENHREDFDEYKLTTDDTEESSN